MIRLVKLGTGASRAVAAAPQAAAAAVAAAAARREFAVEKGASQTDSAEGVKQPFVEGDSQASKRQIKDSYDDILKDRSGTAEDVGALDKAQSTLGRMMADPRVVEQDYAQKGRDTVAAHGGKEREPEDDAVADAVFDQTRSDKGYGETAGQGESFDGTFARKPQ